jgi:hypothetical protein
LFHDARIHENQVYINNAFVFYLQAEFLIPIFIQNFAVRYVPTVDSSKNKQQLATLIVALGKEITALNCTAEQPQRHGALLSDYLLLDFILKCLR